MSDMLPNTELTHSTVRMVGWEGRGGGEWKGRGGGEEWAEWGGVEGEGRRGGGILIAQCAAHFMHTGIYVDSTNTQFKTKIYIQYQ